MSNKKFAYKNLTDKQSQKCESLIEKLKNEIIDLDNTFYSEPTTNQDMRAQLNTINQNIRILVNRLSAMTDELVPVKK